MLSLLLELGPLSLGRIYPWWEWFGLLRTPDYYSMGVAYNFNRSYSSLV